MTIAELIDAMIAELGMEPTREQREALATLGSFLADRNGQSVMVMRGSAGTGKTTLAGAIVRTLNRLGQKIVLLAPTGRAAKVFSLNSGFAASTIHRKIYRQKTFAGEFNLSYNASTDTLFLVDEASMIGMDLLNDLVRFVYSGRNCRMVLIGDHAQLPPVGEEESPALCVPVLRMLGLDVYQSTLSEVLRQSQESGILFNATQIRSMEGGGLPRIRFKGFADIVPVSGNELIECFEQSYRQVGMDETMIITRSNKRSNIYNMGIRNTILDREELLESGDMLMVVKNRYIQGVAGVSGVSGVPGVAGVSGVQGVAGVSGVDFIANGDRARVLRVRHQRELYGFHFADVMLQFPDYDNWEWQTTVITDSLTSEAPALTAEQQELLYNKVMEDYADVRPKSERIRRLKEDIYFNALQVKFGYAVTCHKAQGGQWAHVYVDQGAVNAISQQSPRDYQDYIRWLYTAFTRATERLFLVNWPNEQCIIHNA